MRLPVLVVLAACSAPSPKSPAPPEGRVERLPVSIEAYALSDGDLAVPFDGFVAPKNELVDVLAAAGLPADSIHLDVQCLLVKTGDRVLLFDTGTGNPAFDHTGRLPQSLALAHIDPASVTDIFISHAHSDHVGGLVTKAGALAFPAATIHIAVPEWAYLQTSTEPDDRRLIAAITPKVSMFELGAEVLPLVKAVPTIGHTPGHSSYVIAGELFYLGDLAHHSVISVQRPAWPITVDHDRQTAEMMRLNMLEMLAADHTRVFAGHFPFPGVGHVVYEGQSLVWKPE